MHRICPNSFTVEARAGSVWLLPVAELFLPSGPRGLCSSVRKAGEGREGKRPALGVCVRMKQCEFSLWSFKRVLTILALEHLCLSCAHSFIHLSMQSFSQYLVCAKYHV